MPLNESQNGLSERSGNVRDGIFLVNDIPAIVDSVGANLVM
jgi:hypothetical protein